MPELHRMFAATVALPDGTTALHPRWGDTARYVVYGRDQVGVRRDETPWIARWCPTEQSAQFARAEWQQGYGGEWSVLPVVYVDDLVLCDTHAGEHPLSDRCMRPRLSTTEA